MKSDQCYTPPPPPKFLNGFKHISKVVLIRLKGLKLYVRGKVWLV
jgi:hypothetical protein